MLADALHQGGQAREALALFEEAEAIQVQRQPTQPRLYSLSGYHYCDLLLARSQAQATIKRANYALYIATHGSRTLLDIALANLTLGRAHAHSPWRPRDPAPERFLEQQPPVFLSRGRRNEDLAGNVPAWPRAISTSVLMACASPEPTICCRRR